MKKRWLKSSLQDRTVSFLTCNYYDTPIAEKYRDPPTRNDYSDAIRIEIVVRSRITAKAVFPFRGTNGTLISRRNE